jgi:hypothetical protein
MSLQQVAKHLEERGRGPDSKLVHMSNKELAGLQSLAHAHGKSLTMNPHTGLPEAGILDSILPAAIGIGTAVFAPELLPFVAGAGGLYDYSKTGDLGHGLMTGLSIYGGGSLGESLAASGAASAGAATGEVAQTAANTAGEQAVQQAATQGITDTAAQDAIRQQAMEEAGNATGKITGQGTNMMQGLSNVTSSPGAAVDFAKANWKPLAGIAGAAMMSQPPNSVGAVPGQTSSNYNATRLDPNYHPQIPAQPSPAYQAQYRNYQTNPYSAATGGIVALAEGGMPMGGTVEQMSRENAIGGNQMFPQSGLGGLTGMNTYQNATNTPTGTDVIEPTDAMTDPYTGAMKFAIGGDVKSKKPKYTNAAELAKMNPLAASGAQLNNAMAMAQMPSGAVPPTTGGLGQLNLARGGETYNLGSYSDGGRLLKGPGDGMSDNIPARIGKHQPARLAEGEFVVPADVVSHLGNGSTDAGAKRLYSMMDKVRKARTGNPKQGKQIKAEKYLPA